MSTITVAESRSWLSQLLAGEAALAPFAPRAAGSSVLSPAEAAATARAASCPDLFILNASENACRERLILEVLRNAAAHGERLLAISPDPDAADRLVEALTEDRSLLVVRALADDENPYRPSTVVTRTTSASTAARRAEQLRREMSERVLKLESKIAAGERSRTLRVELAEIERERSLLEGEVGASQAIAGLESVAVLEAERAALRAKRTELQSRPPPKSGLFARLFSRAKSESPSELQQLDVRESQLTAAIAAATHSVAVVSTGPRTTDADARRARLDALRVEAARREAALDECRSFAAAEETVQDGVPNAAGSDLEHELTAARARLQELTAAGPDLARRLLAETQIVIGTPGSLECDPVFTTLGCEPAPFQLLILDRSEELTQAVYEQFAPLASRWILAGDAATPPALNGRSGRQRAFEPTLLSRLAKRLDREPWSIEGSRLVVRLVHLADGERQRIVREAVLDHPHVELGLVYGDGEPVLAEIAFPANTSIIEAKAFLIDQVGAVILRPCGEVEWSRSNDQLTARWPAVETAEGVWIELEAGIRERVVGHGLNAFTAAISFETAVWDEESASAWLAERLTPSASRVATIPCELPVRRPAFAR